MNRDPEEPIRTFVVSLIGAAALTAGLLLLRHQREAISPLSVAPVPPGESVPGEISLERLRERGF